MIAGGGSDDGGSPNGGSPSGGSPSGGSPSGGSAAAGTGDLAVDMVTEHNKWRKQEGQNLPDLVSIYT